MPADGLNIVIQLGIAGLTIWLLLGKIIPGMNDTLKGLAAEWLGALKDAQKKHDERVDLKDTQHRDDMDKWYQRTREQIAEQAGEHQETLRQVLEKHDSMTGEFQLVRVSLDNVVTRQGVVENKLEELRRQSGGDQK